MKVKDTVYRNARYGFAVRYPSDWHVAEKNAAYITAGLVPSEPAQLPAYRTDYYPIFITVSDSRGWNTVRDYYQHICDGEQGCAASADRYAASSSYTPITVAGTQGVKFFGVGGPVSSTIVAFIRGPYLVEITKLDNLHEVTITTPDDALNLLVNSITFP